MKKYFRFGVLIIALGFLALASLRVSSSTERPKAGGTHPSTQQTIAGKLGPATATFTVNSTGDTHDAIPGNGVCNDGTGNCTLRAAIEEANALGGIDTINFNIPSPTPINPLTTLLISSTVIVDGTTQPFFSGTPIIEIQGVVAGQGLLTLGPTASNCTIRGLVVRGNDGDGIRVLGNNNRIVGNFIGTGLSGTTAGPGNSAGGVNIQGGNGNTVGGTAPGDANTIAFNGTGVVVTSGSGNLILANSIFSHFKFGIDLGDDGVNANDPCDGDSGPNGLQNHPDLTGAQSNGSVVAIQGSLNSTPGVLHQIDFYANSVCGTGGFGEGKQFIGSTSITTDAACGGSFSVALPVSVSAGQFITATATDQLNNTSEFSQCVAVVGASCVISCVPNQARFSDPDRCGTVVTYQPPDTSGPCGTVSCNPPSGSFFSKGTTTVVCSAGAGASCSFSINVVDATQPLITCPADLAVPTDPGKTTGVGNYAFAVFGDNCPGSTAVCVPPSGSVFPTGVSIVTCTAKDVAGNTAVCAFRVTVSSQPISITCSPNVTAVPPAGQSSATVSYAPPTVSNSPGATVICSPPSGSSFPLGTTTVNCTASDAVGNRASCSFVVTVGGPQAKLTIAGNPAVVEFAQVPPTRKPPKPKKSPCSSFVIENIGIAPLVLTFDSFKRTGSDVTNGRITDPNDVNAVAVVSPIRFFTLNIVTSDLSLSPLDIGTVLTLQPGQRQVFCVKFAALIPGLTGKTSGLAASDVLPDTVTSAIVFRQNAGANISVPVLAKVGTGVVFIDPANSRRPPVVTFVRSGNDIVISYAVFDSNLDVTRAKYEFLNAGGQVVAGPFEIDLAEAVRSLNLVRGQSFSIEQRFTGASDSPDITAARVTVSDGETAAVGITTSSFAASAGVSSVQSIKQRRDVTLYPPEIRIEPQIPR